MPASAPNRSKRFPSTSFEGVLLGIKDLFLRHRAAAHAFTNVKTFRLGIVPQNAVFPAITVRPASLEFGSWSSGGQYDAWYQTVFEVWTRNQRADRSDAQSLEIYNELEQFLDEHHDLEGRCWDVQFGEVQKDSPTVDDTRNFIHGVFAPVLFRSKETRPAALKYNRFEYDAHKNLPETVFETIRNSVQTQGKINYFQGAPFPPTPVYPSMTVMEATKGRDRAIANIDVDARDFAITIATAVTPHEESILSNLVLTDEIVKILMENRSWGGLAVNSQPVGVSYAISNEGSNEHQFLYASEIRLRVWSRKILPRH